MPDDAGSIRAAVEELFSTAGCERAAADPDEPFACGVLHDGPSPQPLADSVAELITLAVTLTLALALALALTLTLTLPPTPTPTLTQVYSGADEEDDEGTDAEEEEEGGGMAEGMAEEAEVGHRAADA